MPSFRWKGRSAGGHEIEGEISGPSKEHVLRLLRGQGILVTTISAAGAAESEGVDLTAPGSSAPLPVERPESLVERLARERASGGPPRPFRGLLIAGAFVAAAFGVGYFAPVVVCRCERTAAGGVDCTLSERDLGLVTVREQRLAGVTSVDVESKPGSERVVLSNGAGASIRPSAWDHRSGSETSGGEQWLGVSTETMRATIAGFLSESTEARVSTWQGQLVPLVFAAIPLGLAFLTLGLSAIALFKGPTDWLYATLARLAVQTDERRRRQRR